MPEWRFRCPHDHASIELYAHRFHCKACCRAGSGGSYSKDDLYDLASGEEPPHA